MLDAAACGIQATTAPVLESALAIGIAFGGAGCDGTLDAAFTVIVLLFAVASVGTECTKAGGAASASAQLVLYFYVWASWWTGRSAGWWLGGWSDGKEPTLRLGDRVVWTAACLMVGMVITLGVVALAA